MSTEKDQEKIDDSSKSENMISIIVKTSKERETFQVESDANIKKLRELVSERYKVEPHKVCLIFSGKILKDSDTLENHKMKDGYIVHLVIRDVSKLATTSATTTPGASSSTTTTSINTNQSTNTSSPAANLNMNNVPIPPPLPNLGMIFNMMNNSPSLTDFNQFAQQLNNPDFVRQVLDNPLMQNLYSNPEIFRSIISNNPHFQQLIERNPELNHVLSNPEILRQTFDMMRNPAAFQELMRSHDRALSNLESLPGGYNALRRMYTELQEPMLNAAQEQFGVNPFASNTDSSVSTTPSNTENREPLPNPWQRSANSTGTINPTSAGTNTTTTSGTTTNTPNRNPFNFFGSNLNLQQIMQQLNDPNVMQGVMSSSLLQQMMQALADNPQFTSQFVQQQYQQLFGGTSAPDNTAVQSVMNSLSQNLHNPIFQRILTEPQALQALLQIQRGYEQLERIVGVRASSLYELLSSLNQSVNTGASNTSNATPATNSSNKSSTTATTTTAAAAITTTMSTVTNSSPTVTSQSSTTSTIPTSSTNTNTTATSNPPAAVPNANTLTQMMQQMFSMAPETRYQSQLSQLEAMGFNNRQANLQALTETFGNLEAAIDRLLSRM